MYQGFISTTEQDRERWELMQRRAEQIAKQKEQKQAATASAASK